MSERKPFTFPFTSDENATHDVAHEHLCSLMRKLPSDFEPWGERKRDGGDCSCGCAFYLTLEWPLGADWGVCVNPKSPRVGLLTFEHQGCPEFVYSESYEDDDLEVPEVVVLAKALQSESEMEKERK